MRLTNLELERIRRNESVYAQAEQLTGVPWRMLAAIHYEEHSCDPTSPGPGGPFQMDPPPSDTRLQEVLGRFNLPFMHVEEDFLTAAIVAANFLQGKVMGRLHPDIGDEALIKDAFWGYNGRAYGSADNSPYVSNDPPTRVLRVRGSVIGADGQRIFIDREYAKHGAIFIFRELLDLFPRDPSQVRVFTVDDGGDGWSFTLRDESRPLAPYSDVRGREFHFAASCAEGDTLWADWRPALPKAGTYRVEVFVPGIHATTRQALYFVKGVIAPGGPLEQTATVNQLALSDEWATLGEFAFDPAVADSGVVRLTNFSPESPETQIAFDIVKWTLVG
jgi:hypothetical protein